MIYSVFMVLFLLRIKWKKKRKVTHDWYAHDWYEIVTFYMLEEVTSQFRKLKHIIFVWMVFTSIFN